MKKRLLGLTMVCSIVLTAGQSFAATLSLEPSSPGIAVGDTATVDIVISALGDFAPPSLGAFLVEVTFDDGLLAANEPVVGPFLGDPSDPFETDTVTMTGAGVVSVDEISFLSATELDALQPASFLLATLSFTGTSSGTSALGFGLIDLSDAAGFTIDPNLGIDIKVVPVPVPASLILLSSALAGLLGWRRGQGET